MSGRRGYRPPKNYEPYRGGKKKRPAQGESRQSQSHVTRDQTRDQPRERAAKRSQPALAPLRTPPYPETGTRPARADASFADLGLGGNIVRALAAESITRPLPIQLATIPDAVAGYHVLGRGRTGSGKTVAFAAALVERVLRLNAEGVFADIEREQRRTRQQQGQRVRGERVERPARGSARPARALILAPTRELALQLDRTVQPIARSVGLYTGQFVGGQPFEPQLHALARGVDIIIGTPGRIEDLELRGHLTLAHVAITVIDEADHMAELGFIEQVQSLLRKTRRGGQRMLFSATLDRGVTELVDEFMPAPAVHELADAGAEGASRPTRSDLAPARVEHRVLLVLREDKDRALVELVRGGGRTIVFCRTRAYAERVTEMLAAADISALPLHGDLSQTRRERNLQRFTDGAVDVLVATDVAARGIHVDDVDLVLQADAPDTAKTYVHRAGRTGRLGRPGAVVTVIPRTRQKRTRELFAELGFEPAEFAPYTPDADAPEAATRPDGSARPSQDSPKTPH